MCVGDADTRPHSRQPCLGLAINNIDMQACFTADCIGKFLPICGLPYGTGRNRQDNPCTGLLSNPDKPFDSGARTVHPLGVDGKCALALPLTQGNPNLLVEDHVRVVGNIFVHHQADGAGPNINNRQPTAVVGRCIGV